MIDYIGIDVLIVGCGLSGVVLAERLANSGKKVIIIDKRNHIGGNCYDYVDSDTNILMNKYGAHLFHTNNKKVWDYVNKFSDWVRWEHTVQSYVDDTYVPIPVNITTVNKLLNENIHSEDEMKEWMTRNQIKYDIISNSEEMAKSRIGEKLYNKLVKEYTFKQWNKYPNKLDKAILQRIPIRPNFDTRYFNDKYQALPKNGYTKLIENMLNHPNINVKLNVDFFKIKDNLDNTIKIIYTGPIDHYFEKIGYPKLEYRSINFHIEKYYNIPFYQPNSVINYPSKNIPFTRSVEYKHFLSQKSPHTVVVKETTTDDGEPYYPVLNDKNLKLYEMYKELAKKEKNIYFIGRLANFKYFNMDQAIDNSLKFYDRVFKK